MLSRFLAWLFASPQSVALAKAKQRAARIYDQITPRY